VLYWTNKSITVTKRLQPVVLLVLLSVGRQKSFRPEDIRFWPVFRISVKRIQVALDLGVLWNVEPVDEDVLGRQPRWRDRQHAGKPLDLGDCGLRIWQLRLDVQGDHVTIEIG